MSSLVWERKQLWVCVQPYKEEVSHVQSNGLVPGAEDNSGLWFGLGCDDSKLRSLAIWPCYGDRRLRLCCADGGGQRAVCTGEHSWLHTLDRCGGQRSRLWHTQKQVQTNHEWIGITGVLTATQSICCCFYWPAACQGTVGPGPLADG